MPQLPLVPALPCHLAIVCFYGSILVLFAMMYVSLPSKINTDSSNPNFFSVLKFFFKKSVFPGCVQ